MSANVASASPRFTGAGTMSSSSPSPPRTATPSPLAARCPAADRSAGLRVAEVEVEVPGRAVACRLPAPGDPAAIRGEGAGEPLGELQRREVGRVTQECPHAVAEVHRIDAGDAP